MNPPELKFSIANLRACCFRGTNARGRRRLIGQGDRRSARFYDIDDTQEKRFLNLEEKLVFAVQDIGERFELECEVAKPDEPHANG